MLKVTGIELVVEFVKVPLIVPFPLVPIVEVIPAGLFLVQVKVPAGRPEILIASIAELLHFSCDNGVMVTVGLTVTNDVLGIITSVGTQRINVGNIYR